jgi:hypothetical protein
MPIKKHDLDNWSPADIGAGYLKNFISIERLG